MPRRLLSRAFSAWLTALPLLAALAGRAAATTVIPPDFPGLVDRAETVFRGEVVGITADLISREGQRAIFTRVTFRVLEAIKGRPEPLVTLEFLGGTVGELTLEVTGMPRFQAGKQEIVFVAGGGPAISPLVAMAFGRYRIERDATGGEYVARDNGQPLRSVDEVGQPFLSPALQIVQARAADAAGPRPLSPGEFAGQVRRVAARVHAP